MVSRIANLVGWMQTALLANACLNLISALFFAIKHVIRCNARLAGVMPMGFMDKRRCQEALEQYKKELLNKGYVI